LKHLGPENNFTRIKERMDSYYFFRKQYILLTVFTLFSCLTSPYSENMKPDEVIVGIWEIDIAGTKKAPENKDVLSNVIFEYSLELMEGARIIIEEKTITVSKETADDAINDTTGYRIIDISENTVTIESIEKGSMELQARIVIVDKNTIKWYEKDDKDMPVIVLKRIEQ